MYWFEAHMIASQKNREVIAKAERGTGFSFVRKGRQRKNGIEMDQFNLNSLNKGENLGCCSCCSA